MLQIGAAFSLCLYVLAPTPAYAEFELKGARVTRGELEIEYRGSAHHNLPSLDDEEPVRQSHDIEYEYGLTDIFAVSAVTTFEELDGSDFDYAATTLEAQLELVDRPKFAASILTEYQFVHQSGEADEYEIGPVANIWFGQLDILTNSFFTRAMGENAETNSWGLQYDIRARYWHSKRFAYGVEVHGEIEELDNAGPFEDQEHYVGPVLYWNWGEEGEEKEKEGAEARRRFTPKEYAIALGAMFGMTDVTSEAALKVQIDMEF